jgi:hypothetical protein
MITDESRIDSVLNLCLCTYVRFTNFPNKFIELTLPTFSTKNNTTQENN